MCGVLAGLVVALALIPEAISFSIIAGVDPRKGKSVEITGLNEASAERHGRLTGELSAH